MPPPDKPNRRLPCLVESFHRLCYQGRLDQAVDSLPALARRGFRPDSRALAFLLQQCLRSRSLALARRVHLHLKLTGLRRTLPSKTFLANHLIALHFECGRAADARSLFYRMPARNVFSCNAMLAGYAKLGMLRPARLLFDRMPDRDVISWNTMIAALAYSGSCHEAVGFYVQMRRSPAVSFNTYSFSGLLAACVRLTQVGLTRQVHGQLVIVGFLSNLIISSSLVNAYAKCGWIDEARKLFDEMPVRDVLTWTTLVSGYANCGDVVSARMLFDEMPEKNPISWTTLIRGYARNGLSHEALDLFAKMMMEGVTPDQFTISSSLCACTNIASLKHGKQIHAHLIRTHFNSNSVVISSLIDMYSKCGKWVEGQRIFDCTAYSKRDAVLWNTMIVALGQHGYGRRALQLFEEMIREGTKPDKNTFVVILTSCSHSGLVGEGIQIFGSMAQDHGIVPEEEHYACFVDLLGRAGCFEEAMGRVQKTPFRSSALVWNALLGACKIHGNVELGSEAAECLIKSEPQCSAAYVLLSNMYAEVGRWESVENVRCLMEERKVRKERAVSSIEVENTVQSLVVSD